MQKSIIGLFLWTNVAIKVNNLYLMNRCGYNHWSRLCECDCRALNRDVTMRIWEVGCVRLVPARFYALRSRSCKPSHRYFYKPMITAWIHKQGSVFFEVYFSLIGGFSRVFFFFFLFPQIRCFLASIFLYRKENPCLPKTCNPFYLTIGKPIASLFL